MGCKIIKGNELALIILILILSLVPVSCDNNSSNSSTQNFVGNASGSHLQTPSDNISKATETSLSQKSDRLDLLDKIIKIILGIAGLIAILFGIIRWIFPSAEKRLRIRVIAFLKKIGLLKKDPEEASISPGPEKESPKSILKIPLPNPNFTGRLEFLSALSQSLAQAVSRPKIFALVGNGGMGKTQIALKHAYDPKNDFKYVWWLRSEEPSTLIDDYVSIAEDLNLPGWNPRDTDQIVKTVKLWLEAGRESRWLLVFDNAQKPEDLERYIPVAGSGQVILTSRQFVWDGLAETLEVKVFQRDKMQGESIDFLLKRTGKSDRRGAADLASELGDLPLALARRPSARITPAWP